MSNRFALFFAGVLLVMLWTTYSSATGYVDRIVAVVNDDVITLSELESTGRQLFERIKTKAPADEVDATLKKAREDVLSGMIDNMIVRQKAKELSITEYGVRGGTRPLKCSGPIYPNCEKQSHPNPAKSSLRKY